MKNISTQTYNKYLNTLNAISKAIASETYLEDILNLIVMVATNVTEIKICSIWLIDEYEDPQRLRLKVSHAIDPDYIKNRSLGINEGVVGYVATNQQTIIVDDVLKDKRFKEKEMARKLGLVSMIGIPMKYCDGKIVGVLNCFTTKLHKFCESETKLMTTVADQAAIVIFNTELMVRTKLIQEELNTRKLFEKAKEVLVSHRKIGEDQANKLIQKCSMESQKSIRQVSEAILLIN